MIPAAHDCPNQLYARRPQKCNVNGSEMIGVEYLVHLQYPMYWWRNQTFVQMLLRVRRLKDICWTRGYIFFSGCNVATWILVAILALVSDWSRGKLRRIGVMMSNLLNFRFVADLALFVLSMKTGVQSEDVKLLKQFRSNSVQWTVQIQTIHKRLFPIYTLFFI